MKTNGQGESIVGRFQSWMNGFFGGMSAYNEKEEANNRNRWMSDDDGADGWNSGAADPNLGAFAQNAPQQPDASRQYAQPQYNQDFAQQQYGQYTRPYQPVPDAPAAQNAQYAPYAPPQKQPQAADYRQQYQPMQQAPVQTEDNSVNFPIQPEVQTPTISIAMVQRIDEVHTIIEHMRDERCVFLNMEPIATNPAEMQRCIDVLRGAIYALQCGMQKISQHGYIVWPSSMKVMLDERIKSAYRVNAEAQSPLTGYETVRDTRQSAPRVPRAAYQAAKYDDRPQNPFAGTEQPVQRSAFGAARPNPYHQ
ncbi:MAG: cell division protein SepF [Eubacteriales bacterium]|nr:cell division protein SepF [Eubacteriales bacterium]MDD3881699.1 cell division protein SepF [Eubacteriales bacterium]MDD4512242.1 cell division protein SepF [Eubacteriales bacterium]